MCQYESMSSFKDSFIQGRAVDIDAACAAYTSILQSHFTSMSAGDPESHDVTHRKLATYQSYFAIGSYPYTADYLALNSLHDQSRSLSRFRLQCTPLRVEYGRYDNLPYADRKCLRCGMDVVDNERHLVFDCTACEHVRTKFHTLFRHTQDRDMHAFFRQDAKSIVSFIDECTQICISHYNSMR